MRVTGIDHSWLLNRAVPDAMNNFIW